MTRLDSVLTLASRAACFLVLFCAQAAAQTSIVDPSLLAQLTPEERQQLLGGLGGIGGGTSGARNQDQSLNEPEIVRPATRRDYRSSLDCVPISSSDDYYRDSAAGSGSFSYRPSGAQQQYYGSSDARAATGSSQSALTDSPDVAVFANAYADAASGRQNAALEGAAAQRNLGSTGTGYDDRYGNYPNDQRSGTEQVLAGRRCPPGYVERDRQVDQRLEIDRYGTVRRPVQPFGYDLFLASPTTFAPATDIPVPTDYVVGPGDNLRVQLFGNQNDVMTLLVQRDGTVNFPKLGPIEVAGLSFDELQGVLEQRVSKEMIGTTISLTLGRMRSIRVFVLGDVNQPGSYTVSSLSTMTHALYVSGGVKTVGSLRDVQLKRNGKIVQRLDLYDFLLKGDSSADARLQAGDVVFVPPVAARVTVDGEVKRPAIYELKGERSLREALQMAGGELASADRVSAQIERIDAGSDRKLIELNLQQPGDFATPIRDGDVVRVRAIAKQIGNELRVVGYVKHPGIYPLTPDQDLRSLLRLAGILESDARAEVYFPLGIIERTNTSTGIREFKSFNVTSVNQGSGQPIPLEANDLIIIFSRADIEYLSSADVELVLKGRAPIRMTCAGVAELRSIINSQRAVRFLRTLASESARLPDSTRQSQECPRVFEQVPRALPYLLDRGVGVYGEVVRPGIYPVAPDTTFELLVQSAGGRTSESDAKNVEYISYVDSLADGRSHYQVLDSSSNEFARTHVAAGDILNFRPVYLDQEVGSVRLMGEFRFPGSYSIVRGETLSQVIERAGGLTNNAFTYGAVYTRESARRAEEASYKRAAADLQEAVITVVTSGVLGSEASSAAQFMDGAIRRLNNAPALGRVVIQADPTVLRVRPELDVALEPGDVLMIPKRPSTVSVIGQVLSPGTLAFQPGASAKYYIDQAGGYGQASDKKRGFVVLPDGTARVLKVSAWNSQRQDIPPGSSIVVPRDAAPLNAMVLTERVTGILSNLALSAAALVTVTNH